MHQGQGFYLSHVDLFLWYLECVHFGIQKHINLVETSISIIPAKTSYLYDKMA